MAKICNLLKDLREKISRYDDIDILYSYFEDGDGKLREFLSIFDNIEDSRMKGKCKYSTMTIVGIVFLALLHELDSWTEIEMFAKHRKDIVSKYVDISSGIPSHDTLKRVFSLINSETLESALVDFLQRSIEVTAKILDVSDEEMKMIAMDGKELKGTGRKYNTDEKIRNGQIMHFYDVSTGVCIKSQLIEEKTNEIPTAQRILASLNIKNMVITSDAMNCQKDTVKIIVESKGHYVLGLKRNHSDFFNEIKDIFSNEPKKTKKNYYKMETEKNHNQVEIREFYKISANQFVYADDWKNIKNVIMYKKTMINNHSDQEKIEKRYYISDLDDVHLIGEAIRRHWAIENELHWHLDVNLHEDSNKTMDKKAACNLSIIKKSILTILKLMQPLYGKSSIRLIRKTFTVDYDRNLMMLFAFLDEQNLRKLVSSK